MLHRSGELRERARRALELLRADELERAFDIADELGLRRLDQVSWAAALSVG
jgi:hypothetical protein